MKEGKSDQYISKKHPDGADVYCPLSSDNESASDTVDVRDDCVEKDVVERYSGNIVP